MPKEEGGKGGRETINVLGYGGSNKSQKTCRCGPFTAGEVCLGRRREGSINMSQRRRNIELKLRDFKHTECDFLFRMPKLVMTLEYGR